MRWRLSSDRPPRSRNPPKVSIAYPPKYRYTGVVGPIAGGASHAIEEGGGLKFSFADKNRTNAPSYRLCLSKKGSGSPFRCWDRPQARSYFDRFQVGNIYPSPYGPLVAKWIVGGRVVARWEFFYSREGE